MHGACRQVLPRLPLGWAKLWAHGGTALRHKPHRLFAVQPRCCAACHGLPLVGILLGNAWLGNTWIVCRQSGVRAGLTLHDSTLKHDSKLKPCVQRQIACTYIHRTDVAANMGERTLARDLDIHTCAAAAAAMESLMAWRLIRPVIMAPNVRPDADGVRIIKDAVEVRCMALGFRFCTQTMIDGMQRFMYGPDICSGVN